MDVMVKVRPGHTYSCIQQQLFYEPKRGQMPQDKPTQWIKCNLCAWRNEIKREKKNDKNLIVIQQS